jgi:hypothetical protein
MLQPGSQLFALQFFNNQKKSEIISIYAEKHADFKLKENYGLFMVKRKLPNPEF